MFFLNLFFYISKSKYFKIIKNNLKKKIKNLKLFFKLKNKQLLFRRCFEMR